MSVAGVSLTAGHRLDDYEIERVLDLSETAITYQARDVVSGRPVALHEYFPRDCARRGDDGEVRPAELEVAYRFKQGRDTFRANAKAALRIRHPGLAEAERYFAANNTVYLVTGYVAGSTLLDILEHRSRLSEAELYRLFTDILPALAEVHAHGALHLNVTPRNIIRRPDGRWVLTGIAAGGIDTPRGYAAPERYGRNQAELGPQTDLYAFAMAAYRCISGVSESALMDAPERVRAQGGGAQLAPAVRAGKRRYPHRLLAATDRACAVQVTDRPASARELLAAVAVAGPRQAAAPARRRFAGLAALAALLLIGGSALGFWYYERGVARATGIDVTANVAGAEVFLNGAAAGRAGPTTPLVLEGLEPGAHRLRVRHAGYRPYADTVYLSKGRRRTISVRLEPELVTLSIDANVTDYALFIDGSAVQPAAPDRFAVPVGAHRLRIEKDGHRPHEQTLSVHSGSAPTLRVTLEPKCRQVARVEEQCQDQPLQRFREQLVVERKVLSGRGYGELRVLGNPLYADVLPEDVQNSACANARRSAESRLLALCRKEPRDGELFLADVDYQRCTCEPQHTRDIYGRRALATVQCRVAARAVCATEVRRAVRYTDANPQCEDVLVQETLCD